MSARAALQWSATEQGLAKKKCLRYCNDGMSVGSRDGGATVTGGSASVPLAVL